MNLNAEGTSAVADALKKGASGTGGIDPISAIAGAVGSMANLGSAIANAKASQSEYQRLVKTFSKPKPGLFAGAFKKAAYRKRVEYITAQWNKQKSKELEIADHEKEAILMQAEIDSKKFPVWAYFVIGGGTLLIATTLYFSLRK